MIDPLTWTVMVVVFLGVYACFITWAYMTSYGKTEPKPDEVLEIHPTLWLFDSVVADYKNTSFDLTVSRTKMEIAIAAFALARKAIEMKVVVRDQRAMEVAEVLEKLEDTLTHFDLPPVFKKGLSRVNL